jgi:hypothetical protein
MPRGRGGKRQGTPGKGYTNRTDLMNNYDQEAGSPAAGGVEAPPQPMGPTPDDSPNLSDATQYATEPITSGLPIGPGSGPQRDTRMQETQQLRKYLPLLETYLDQPETPNSVRLLFRYIRGS